MVLNIVLENISYSLILRLYERSELCVFIFRRVTVYVNEMRHFGAISNAILKHNFGTIFRLVGYFNLLIKSARGINPLASAATVRDARPNCMVE